MNKQQIQSELQKKSKNFFIKNTYNINIDKEMIRNNKCKSDILKKIYNPIRVYTRKTLLL